MAASSHGSIEVSQREWRIAAAAATIGLLYLGLFVARVFPHAISRDFAAFYVGAGAVKDGLLPRLYDLDLTLERERAAWPGVTEVIPANRPAFYYPPLAPLAWMPYPSAFWCWIALQAAALAGCWLWGFRAWGYRAVVMSFLYPPIVLGIAHGQDCALLLAVLLGAYSLARARRDFACGLVLALGLVKFHLFALWVPALVIQKRWKMLVGYVAMAALELALFALLAGGQGMQSYVELLSRGDVDAQMPPLLKQVSLRGFLGHFGVTSTVLVCLAAGGVAALVLWRTRNAALWELFSLATVGSLIVAPRVLVYDLAMALLPLWLVAFGSPSRAARYGAVLLASPVALSLIEFDPPWTLAPSGLLLCFLVLILLPRGTKAPCHETSPGAEDRDRAAGGSRAGHGDMACGDVLPPRADFP